MTPSLVVLAAVLGTALASMPIFALATRGRLDPDAARKGSSFLLGIGNFLVHWLMWAIGPLERAVLRAGAGPDLMNATGLGFGLLSGILIGSGRLEAGGWAIALAGISDILDGRLARARQLVSPYGKFVDATLDRFVETFAFLGFAVYFAAWPNGPLGALHQPARARDRDRLAACLRVAHEQREAEPRGHHQRPVRPARLPAPALRPRRHPPLPAVRA